MLAGLEEKINQFSKDLLSLHDKVAGKSTNNTNTGAYTTSEKNCEGQKLFFYRVLSAF